MPGIIRATVHGPTASAQLLVDFTSVAAAATAATVTVTRTSPATVLSPAATVPVRSLHAVPAPAGVTAGFDGEAPIGLGLTYVATCYDADGVLLATTDPVKLRIPNELQPPGTVWIKSLVHPDASVRMLVRDLPEWADDSYGSLSRGLGSSLASATIDVRGGLSGSLTLKAESAAQRAGLDALLALAEPVYLLQFSAAAEEPDRYVWLGGRKQKRAQRWEAAPLRWIELDVVEVLAPDTEGAAVVVPGQTFANANASTFAGLTATRFVDGLS